MTTFRRLASGGLVDRTQTLNFSLDGAKLDGFSGDTLASALLAHDRMLVARSFKYHRPRGIMTAGIEEPNALFTIGEKDRAEPNIPATTLELRDGLKAASQNAWPSPRFDVMAMNTFLAPVLGAGFYYKTFMGPLKKSWMWYEPVIRKAAGLGRGTLDADTARYETCHGFCDVLVVGSGPAGLAAALTAARTGLRVVLAEQDFALGGTILSQADDATLHWCASIERDLRQHAEVRILNRTTVQGMFDHNQAILARKTDSGMTIEMLRARMVIFATGSTERPMVFSNNDRPGVMLASGLRTYLNRYAVAPAQSAVIATNNDSAYQCAFDLSRAGVAVTVADARKTLGADVLARAAQAGIALFPNTGIADVEGAHQLRRVKLSGARNVTIEADILAMSGGWSPNVHLTSQGGVRPVYNDSIAAFVPGKLP